MLSSSCRLRKNRTISKYCVYCGRNGDLQNLLQCFEVGIVCWGHMIDTPIRDKKILVTTQTTTPPPLRTTFCKVKTSLGEWRWYKMVTKTIHLLLHNAASSKHTKYVNGWETHDNKKMLNFYREKYYRNEYTTNTDVQITNKKYLFHSIRFWESFKTTKDHFRGDCCWSCFDLLILTTRQCGNFRF